MKIGLIHPGLMGASVGAAAKTGRGNEVLWASTGRSEATAGRAKEQGFEDAGSVSDLAGTCDAILSICPPECAEEVAAEVTAAGFRGLYLDGNAISPERSRRIGKKLSRAGITFVDGGIIGPPAWSSGTTWLVLSGPAATDVASLFDAGPFQCNVIGDEIGRASALKMVFAAYTKGSTALLCGILATAEALGVRGELAEQWRLMGMGLDEKAPRDARLVTAKAWRFVAEMEEIAATFEEAGLPGGFHDAAAEVYRRLAGFKRSDEQPDLDSVLNALMRSPEFVPAN